MSSEDSARRVRSILRLIALFSLLLIALGGFVRATGAGLACPDWPMCYGVVVPPMHEGVFQEYAHRVLAGIVSLLTLFLCFSAYRIRKEYRRLFIASLLLFILVIVQAVFGGLTVLLKLHPHVVATHLVLGTLFFQAVALFSIERMAGEKQVKKGNKFSLFILALIIAVSVQIALGGMVASSGASLACPDFPLCFGELIPASPTKGQVLQIVHRALGILVFLLLFIGLFLSKKYLPQRQKRGHLIGMVSLVFLQIIIGASNVWFQVPIVLAILHLIVAQLILLGLTSLYREMSGRWNVFHSGKE